MRQAISEKLAADNQLSYRASQIVVSSGAKHACYNAILATCQPDDEVVIPAPYWVSYPEMVQLAGAEPVIIPTMERNVVEDAGGRFRERDDAADQNADPEQPMQSHRLGLYAARNYKRSWTWPRRRIFTFCRTKFTKSSSTTT